MSSTGLEALDAGQEGTPFAGLLDLHRVGGFGHSTGGAVITAAALADARIRALVVYDVVLPRILFGEDPAVPLMLMRTDDTRYPPGWADRLAETFDHLSEPGYDLTLLGGGHNSFGDQPYLFPERYPYRLNAARAMEITRRFTLDFFDAYLRGGAVERLTTEVPEEVAVVVHDGRVGQGGEEACQHRTLLMRDPSGHGEARWSGRP